MEMNAKNNTNNNQKPQNKKFYIFYNGNAIPIILHFAFSILHSFPAPFAIFQPTKTSSSGFTTAEGIFFSVNSNTNDILPTLPQNISNATRI